MIDFRLSSKCTSDELSFSSYFKVNAFFQIATFRFFEKRNPPHTETLTILFTLRKLSQRNCNDEISNVIKIM